MKLERTPFWRVACALALGVAALLTPFLATAGEKPPLHHVSAQACGSCHQKIFDQWQGSMHGQSTALADPIHAAFYGMLAGDPRQEGVTLKANGQYPVCLLCHAPNAARDKVTKLDALPAYAEGVNCVACHTQESFKGVDAGEGKLNLGVAAYTFSEERLQGPNGAWNGPNPAPSPGGAPEPSVNPFPHAQNGKLFKTSEVCLGCHEKRNNTHGVPLCATGLEVVASGNTVTCQSCHMPVVDGVTDHSMVGGHDRGMLQRGLILGVDVEKTGEGAQAKVSLKNILPHNYPTGAPFRFVFVRVTALDAAGQALWSNFEKSPMEDANAVLMLKLVDDEGKPAAPPEAKKIAGDTRLAPGAEKVLAYALPAGTAVVRAEAFYNLLLPPFVQKLGDKLPPPLTQPVSVARAEAVL